MGREAGGTWQPRDWRGRWIKIGDRVRLVGAGRAGTVKSADKQRGVTVQWDDGGTTHVAPHRLLRAPSSEPAAPASRQPEEPDPAATPHGADAYFTRTGQPGDAWVRYDETGDLDGWIRLDRDDPSTTVRYREVFNDPAWRSQVDAMGLREAPPPTTAVPASPLPRRRPRTDQPDRIVGLVTGIHPTQPIGQIVQHVLPLIDTVHKMPPGMPEITLAEETRPGYQGSYTGRRLLLNPHGEYPHLTVAHELMHYLDHRIGYGKGEFLSDRDIAPGGILHSWWVAAGNSRMAQALRDLRNLPDGMPFVRRQSPTGDYALTVDHDYIDYILSHREMLARSYAQWIALRTQDPKMLADLDRAIDRYGDHPIVAGTNIDGLVTSYNQFWDLPDFTQIADELEDFFIALGLLR
ncbi:hypothetical protein SAMN05421505_12036 [Sinosporangium album]|uniref:Uncharacterized protein n=1 Tax=Sinosporangium album TaxID=504805 RepID=A0A1G8ECD2_9ACTN|nr:hypothetical protein [Sinosporangium album]SDH67528.1 hypothetical protein SAMN05421505_12036 [Sinosporangium album]